MTANEMIRRYVDAPKYKSMRFKAAKFAVKDRLGDTWRTLFCCEDFIVARGYANMLRGNGDYRPVIAVDRDGNRFAI